MENDQTFYCVGCNTLHAGDVKSVRFRTGYFRISYPLGLCGRCRLFAVVPQEPAPKKLQDDRPDLREMV